MNSLKQIFAIGILLASVSLFSKTFTIGVEKLHYLPYYDTKKGKYMGFSRELFDMFAKDSGYTIIYKPLSVKRLVKMFLTNRIDFRFPDNKYWDQDQKKGKSVFYSDKIVRYTDGVMVVPQNLGKGLKHLKKLGTVMGFTTYEYLQYIKSKQIILKENPRLVGLLKQTIRQRIDGAYVNADVAKYVLEKINKSDSLVFDKTLPYSQDYFYLSTIKHPEVLKQFNKWMKN